MTIDIDRRSPRRAREGDGARRTVLGTGAQPERRADGVAGGQGEGAF